MANMCNSVCPFDMLTLPYRLAEIWGLFICGCFFRPLTFTYRNAGGKSWRELDGVA